ncbi:galactose-1-phosphate uridylyltransferase [Nannocystis radixulma]|uniref:Galactose-1-phosphate uridylyltransferase n=1 Tax=Nannocystis radixulma TaxID=2995305 RepID=A0ABT5BM84_9BACT|nr:galactose-1-phosphate uridylyltransferase [Nannocystis radixulma]MDC0675279.1 galactose-1-phosphate uridylyltransferase [Nannocystis radixulma]
MYKRSLTKPDGRHLHLYGRSELPADCVADGPRGGQGGSHMRWHPLRGEWVVYATHRQTRTFLPPPEYNPLLPTRDPSQPTEVPGCAWDVAVFDNLYPSLASTRVEPPACIVDTAPGVGACEVVVFSRDPHGSLGGLPLAQIELILEVWADRTRELGARDDIAYVFPFENRGVEVGVTLHHPHGQIYAYPFVPPLVARELANQRTYHATRGSNLLLDLLRAEITEGERLVYAGDRAVALVPVCARYAYEVWVAPLVPCPSLLALDAATRRDLARALKTTLLKYDGLWGKPFPYVMACYQAPSDGDSHPESQLRIEFYPPYRMPGRLKYLAGTELGAGVFTAETLPEDKARELRAVEVRIDD